MKVVREGHNLRKREPRPVARKMKLVPFDELSPEEQAKHRGGKKSKRARKNVWVPA